MRFAEDRILKHIFFTPWSYSDINKVRQILRPRDFISEKTRFENLSSIHEFI